MERFIKKFVDCFDEDLQKIICDAERSIYKDNIFLVSREQNLKRIEDEKISDSEYRIKYNGSTRENDIINTKSIIKEYKKSIAKNENKISFYHNMKKILSIL